MRDRRISPAPEAYPAAPGCGRALFPFQRPLLPCIDEAEPKLDEEEHHRGPAGKTDPAKGDRPWIEECRLEIEDDEEDGYEIEAHVELGAAILERGKSALIFSQLLRVWLIGASELGGDNRQHDECAGKQQRHPEKQQDRQILRKIDQDYLALAKRGRFERLVRAWAESCKGRENKPSAVPPRWGCL